MNRANPDPLRVTLDGRDLELMRGSALVSAPREACGLWLGCELGHELQVLEVRVLENHAPGRGAFRLDPGELRRALQDAEERGLRVLGSWHSHPSGGARPSSRDLDGSPAGWCLGIVAGPPAQELRAWWCVEGRPRELELVQPP